MGCQIFELRYLYQTPKEWSLIYRYSQYHSKSVVLEHRSVHLWVTSTSYLSNPANPSLSVAVVVRLQDNIELFTSQYVDRSCLHSMNPWFPLILLRGCFYGVSDQVIKHSSCNQAIRFYNENCQRDMKWTLPPRIEPGISFFHYTSHQFLIHLAKTTKHQSPDLCT